MQSRPGAGGRPAQDRFGLTRAWVQRTRGGLPLTDVAAFDRVRDLLLPQLRPLAGSSLQMKNEVEAGQDLLLGFAHDYETFVGARVEKDGDNANTLVVFMAGVGLVLGYDSNTSWRMVSSFPFMLRGEWPLQSMNDVRGQAVARMDDVYQQYTRAFTQFLGRFNKPGQGYSGNYFAQLTRAEVHKEALAKITTLGIEGMLNADLSERLRDIIRDSESLIAHTSFLFDKIKFLLDTTLGFINVNQNKIIKIFSVASVVFLPPTMIASIYGMNFRFMPELDWSGGYPFAIGLMVLSAVTPFLYFKRRNWL